jgi:hypothetical protein
MGNIVLDVAGKTGKSGSRKAEAGGSRTLPAAEMLRVVATLLLKMLRLK